MLLLIYNNNIELNITKAYDLAEKNGYSVVRELVGHGVGARLHESPEVPNYGKRGRGVKLREGLVIAIEPMINMGTKDIVQLNSEPSLKENDSFLFNLNSK